jgi:LEA14-like dessication related protein
VKIRFFGKEIVLIVCFVILFSAFAFAAEDQMVSIRGKVMSLDLSRNRIVVSEQIFVWDTNTKFYNEHASPITVDQIKAKNWVYIEGVARQGKPIMIQTLSLLPK